MIVDPAVVKAAAGTWLMAFTTLAGAGFNPNPASLAVVLPVTETRTMTSTASTTSTVPKTPTVRAVLRFEASFADRRREAAPAVLRPAGGRTCPGTLRGSRCGARALGSGLVFLT